MTGLDWGVVALVIVLSSAAGSRGLPACVPHRSDQLFYRGPKSSVVGDCNIQHGHLPIRRWER